MIYKENGEEFSLEDIFKKLEDFRKEHPIRYFFQRCYYIPRNRIRSIYDWLKYFYQRNTRGYDDLARWNISHYVIQKSLPMLKDFRKNLRGHPGVLDSMEEWEVIVDKIIYGFELIDLDEKGLRSWQKEDQEHIEEACNLFGKWLLQLWS